MLFTVSSAEAFGVLREMVFCASPPNVVGVVRRCNASEASGVPLISTELVAPPVKSANVVCVVELATTAEVTALPATA
ncbi:MAG: hypothetical protein ACD_81C00019G0002 [uncultured bacterium]|nr:MAG: hypothetical protein ACD_81C00019G0002 [uncultured bacterium]